MPRFDDTWDPFVDQMDRELAAAEREFDRESRRYEERLTQAAQREVGLRQLVEELRQVIIDTPFHAYCAWRQAGHQRNADVMNEWQARRDDVFRRASEATL